MSDPACYLVFAPSVEPIISLVYHSHAQELLGEIPGEIVVPMSTCVADPGVVDVSFDQVNNVIIVTPVGGGAPLAMVFTGAGAAAMMVEEKEDDW